MDSDPESTERELAQVRAELVQCRKVSNELGAALLGATGTFRELGRALADLSDRADRGRDLPRDVSNRLRWLAGALEVLANATWEQLQERLNQ